MSLKSQSGAQSIQRALALLQVFVEQRPSPSLSAAAQQLNIRLSTAYRLTAQLQNAGLLVRTARGQYAGGLTLRRFGQQVCLNATVAALARPLLRNLVSQTGRVAHLGTFEDEMVTYLVREAPPLADVFTREGMQLEAYCTAIGKALLAEIPPPERDAYINAGNFVPLTPKTIVNQQALYQELELVSQLGYAVDNEESIEGLFCIAVRVESHGLDRQYAISSAGAGLTRSQEQQWHADIAKTSRALSRKLVSELSWLEFDDDADS